MLLADFFSSQAVRLPRNGGPDSESFDTFLHKLFDQYLTQLKDVDDPGFGTISGRIKGLIPDVERLSSGIVDVVKRVLEGHPFSGYAILEALLESVGVERLFSTLSCYVSDSAAGGRFDPILTSALHPTLYRLRSDATVAAYGQLSRKDMFHVPFEKRRSVRNHRYSIPGLPCLYLGSSVWICWEELGRPNLDSLLLSRFEFADDLVVLDFHFPPDLAWLVFQWANGPADLTLPENVDIEKKARYNDEFVLSYILFWPLIAGCSIKVLDREGTFHPEYIVPQLLLRWVTATKKYDVSGIRYFSTRTPAGQWDVFAHSNCVFPARQIAATGLCGYLLDKFRLTIPIAWQLLKSYDDEHKITFGPTNFGGAITINEELKLPYGRTEFFAAELFLLNLSDKGFAKKVDS